jgi:hypothetical protein
MSENLKIISKLLGDFNNFINNRSTTFLVWPTGTFQKILELHFRIWKKEYQYLSKENKLDQWGQYSEMSRTLDLIFRHIEVRALKERVASLYFQTLKKHVERHKKEVVDNRSYAESLSATFYQVFFEHIANSPERYNIWEHYFPKEWKITKSNLENKENIISGVSLRNFLEWAQERIWQAKEEFDQELNDVSSNLFPETEPILWARILIFIFSPYGENRMKSVIERRWNFGLSGRFRIYAGEIDDKEPFGKFREEETRDIMNTFELAYFLFQREFSKDNLKSYIESLKHLEYKQESENDKKRLELLNIFTKMLDSITKKESSSNSK